MKFSNRKGSNLNRKVFEVEEVVRDASGEIVRIIGKLLRADDNCSGGTPLDEKTLNLMQHKYYIESRSGEMIQNAKEVNQIEFKIYVAEEIDAVAKNTDGKGIFINSQMTDVYDDVSYLNIVVQEGDSLKQQVGDGTISISFDVELKLKSTGEIIGTETFCVEYYYSSISAND